MAPAFVAVTGARSQRPPQRRALRRTARDVLHAGALRLALQLAGHLLMIVIWVAALLGAAHAALAVMRDLLRRLAFVGICAAVGAPAMVPVTI